MKRNIAYWIERLLAYAFAQGLIEEADVIPCRNALLDALRVGEPADAHTASAAWSEPVPDNAVPMLEPMLDYAAETGLLPDDSGTYRDLLDARIMGLLMPRASEVARRFAELAEHSAQAATNYFYRLSVASNYIRLDRAARNEYWLADTPYGQLEITINLSKPEKNPREIALLKNAPASAYPKCVLCADNAGYAGRLNHPARQNHRIVPVELCGERWFLQYSPYVYYNEHSIVLSEEHRPMAITPATLERLVHFIEQFPHYFIGSNADLPIVGGSILNHDHFQAGRHRFPMEKAPLEQRFAHPEFAGVEAGIVAWPMSVVRLAGSDRTALLAAATRILEQWRSYSDPERDILAWTRDNDAAEAATPHNTITPIARFNAQGQYELDLVLRNNRTSPEHPDGIFHPHRHLHHIKQENIGLIEVMGLAVLPGRLQEELGMIRKLLTAPAGSQTPLLAEPIMKHEAWIRQLIARYGTGLEEAQADQILKREVGLKFLEVLNCAGVFRRNADGAEGFRRFLAQAGFAI